MRLTKLLPGPPEELVMDSAASPIIAALYETPATRWLRINLVTSVNGNVVGADGTSNGLTNATDRRILGAIRRRADIVLVGASSVRKEGYFLPKTAPLAIVTGTGDLTGHKLPTDSTDGGELEDGRVIVLCPPDAVATLKSSLAGAAATIVTLPSPRKGARPRIDPVAIIDALRERGYDRIVCEGGPSLASQLIESGLVDELCLSTSPVINGVNLPAFHGLAQSKALTLTQLLVDPEGVLYARWAVQNAAVQNAAAQNAALQNQPVMHSTSP